MCKACRSLGRKEYYKKNKETFKDNYLNNRETKIAKVKEYYNNNKAVVQEKNNQYYANNKAKINLRKNVYEKEKRTTDSLYKLKHNIRRNIKMAIAGKGFTKKSKTTDILGCSFEVFKAHIEAQFLPWMNWPNQGLYNGQEAYGWDFDHIIPISSATCEVDVMRLNHYTNFQPLCSKVNRDIKKGKLGSY